MADEKKYPTHLQAPSQPTDDDLLEAEIRAEIRRIKASIDTIIRKVDEVDPVFRGQDSADTNTKPTQNSKPA